LIGSKSSWKQSFNVDVRYLQLACDAVAAGSLLRPSIPLCWSSSGSPLSHLKDVKSCGAKDTSSCNTANAQRCTTFRNLPRRLGHWAPLSHDVGSPSRAHPIGPTGRWVW
jgi:hypothetical protein